MGPATKQIVKKAERLIKVSLPPVPRTFFVPNYFKDPDGHRRAKIVLSQYSFTAHVLALAGKATGKRDFIISANDIVLAWEDNNVEISTKGDSLIVAAYKTAPFFSPRAILNDFSARNFGWIREVFLPAMWKLKRRTLWKNNHYTWALYSLIGVYSYLGRTDKLKALAKDLRRHIHDQVLKIDGSLGRRNELWRENLRNNSGLWYTYFCLAPATQAAWILKRTIDVDLFPELKSPLLRYFQYAAGLVKWPQDRFPYKKYSGWRGEIQQRLWPSDSKFLFWRGYNLFEAMGHIYGIREFSDFVASRRPVVGGNVWQYPTAYIEMGLI